MLSRTGGKIFMGRAESNESPIPHTVIEEAPVSGFAFNLQKHAGVGVEPGGRDNIVRRAKAILPAQQQLSLI